MKTHQKCHKLLKNAKNCKSATNYQKCLQILKKTFFNLPDHMNKEWS